MTGYLLDENLPADLRLPTPLPTMAAEEVEASASDGVLWESAQDRRLCIVSKDFDFAHRAMVTLPPPWVVHLRLGNPRKRALISRVEEAWPKVETLLRSHRLVTVHPDTVLGFG